MDSEELEDPTLDLDPTACSLPGVPGVPGVLGPAILEDVP